MASKTPVSVVRVPPNIQEFADLKCMKIKHINAQRTFGPSRSMSTNYYPPDGSELFIGRIPRDLFEPELVPFLEQAGPIFQLRLLMDFSGTNRGYGFVQYFNPDQATQASRILNRTEIRPGKIIVVTKSVDNRQLVLGGIPTYKTREEIYKELDMFSEGVVYVWKQWINPPKNPKGSVLVTYRTHRAAALARSKMLANQFTLWGYIISISWALPMSIPERPRGRRGKRGKKKTAGRPESSTLAPVPCTDPNCVLNMPNYANDWTYPGGYLQMETDWSWMNDSGYWNNDWNIWNQEYSLMNAEWQKLKNWSAFNLNFFEYGGFQND